MYNFSMNILGLSSTFIIMKINDVTSKLVIWVDEELAKKLETDYVHQLIQLTKSVFFELSIKIETFSNALKNLQNFFKIIIKNF